MKCILLLVSVVFTVSQAQKPSQEMIDLGVKMEKSYQKCSEKHSITPAQLENLKKFQLPLDKNIQCAFACVAKDSEIMKADNTLDKTKIEIIIKMVTEDLKKANQEDVIKRVNEVVDICLPLQKENSDECAAANKAVECVIENGKKNGLLKN